VNNSDTQKFTYVRSVTPEIKHTLGVVYAALNDKGYNAFTQIIGYILSGDPTYITAHNGARSLIGKLERDELLEELLRHYLSAG
jgi:uncharacterized protein (UPF0297 family)